MLRDILYTPKLDIIDKDVDSTPVLFISLIVNLILYIREMEKKYIKYHHQIELFDSFLIAYNTCLFNWGAV